jgi:hypothetical protein
MVNKDRWFFPTNTNNMRMIIAQGLLASPDGFKKYYTDALELLPGWIPIYKNKIPPDILEKGVSERENLTPCIIEFELNTIKGVVKVIKDNELVDTEIENIDEDKIYILAPLPLSCIIKIIFKSNDDKKQFEDDAKNRSNVLFAGLKLQSTKVDQKLFNETSANSKEIGPEFFNETSPILENSKEKFSTNNQMVDYSKVYSYGGLLLTMFYFAKNGNYSNEIYHFINRLNVLSESKENDIYIIYEYFKSHRKETGLDPKELMYNGLIDIAIENRDFKEEIIEFLESDEWNEKTKQRTLNIANKLKTFETIADKTVSEQFKEAKTLLEKILLMLFLREDSESLIGYNLDVFTEEDYIQFAMMFGIRDQFSKVPKFLREFNGLQNFISYKMAVYAHKQANSNLHFESPQEPLTLMDMLKNNKFKKWFAKQLKIEDCFQTKIIIPKGEYELKVTGSGVEIIFDGIVKTPTSEIIEEKYFEFMSKYELIDYKKYLTKYNKIK